MDEIGNMGGGRAVEEFDSLDEGFMDEEDSI